MAVLASPVGVTAIARPAAPLDLTPEESIEWEAIVGAMPAEWFPRETWPLLTQYCRHTVTARRVAQLIDAEVARPQVDVEAMRDLLAMQRQETAALKAMAAAMRLAQQSKISAMGAAGASDRRTVNRPWEAVEAD